MEIPEGTIPQEVFGHRMLAADGAQWEQSIRAASEYAMETYALAQEIVSESRYEKAELIDRLAREKDRAEKWKEKTKALREKLARKDEHISRLTAKRKKWQFWKRS
jgi:predicted nuclease with TOPRIM domain